MDVEAAAPCWLWSWWGGVLSCALLAGVFVGSLYVWPQSAALDRNAPLQIKRRFASVGLACIAATAYVWLLASSQVYTT